VGKGVTRFKAGDEVYGVLKMPLTGVYVMSSLPFTWLMIFRFGLGICGAASRYDCVETVDPDTCGSRISAYCSGDFDPGL
jgi:hypothetical protein